MKRPLNDRPVTASSRVRVSLTDRHAKELSRTGCPGRVGRQAGLFLRRPFVSFNRQRDQNAYDPTHNKQGVPFLARF